MMKLSESKMYPKAIEIHGKQLVDGAFVCFLEQMKLVIEYHYDTFVKEWEVVFFIGYLQGIKDGIRIKEIIKEKDL